MLLFLSDVDDENDSVDVDEDNGDGSDNGDSNDDDNGNHDEFYGDGEASMVDPASTGI